MCFRKKCKNKESNQKLEAAIAMAHRAEQTSIQVGQRSAHPSRAPFSPQAATLQPLQGAGAFPSVAESSPSPSAPESSPSPSEESSPFLPDQSSRCLQHPLLSLPLDTWSLLSAQTQFLPSDSSGRSRVGYRMTCEFLLPHHLFQDEPTRKEIVINLL